MPHNLNSQNCENKITSLRLPVFCMMNKPFFYIKVTTDSEKYRVSLSPEFMKLYNLNFQILRDVSLEKLLTQLKKSSNLNGIINKSLNPEKFQSPSIFMKLPKKESFKVKKHTIILEEEHLPGITYIDKYEFHYSKDKNTTSKTSIVIIDRVYNDSNECSRNASITFISDHYNNLIDFLDDYSLYL